MFDRQEVTGSNPVYLTLKISVLRDVFKQCKISGYIQKYIQTPRYVL